MSDVNDSAHHRKDFNRNDLIAAARKLWGTETSRPTRTEWRFGSHGSKSIKLDDLVWHDHETSEGGGVATLMKLARMDGTGAAHQEKQKEQEKPNIYYSYKDENGAELFQVVRQPGHKFLQRHQLPDGTWTWNVKGVRRVLYRLPELTRSANTAAVFIVEGEKDAINLAALGTVTTTNPGGAGKWRNEYSEFLRDRIAVILPDNDAPGHAHANQVAAALAGVARSVKVVKLPSLGHKEDVSDWIKRGGTREALEALVNEEPEAEPATAPQDDENEQLPQDITLADFLAFLPKHQYLYTPTQTLWPQQTINSRLPKVNGTKPARWLDKNRAISQMIWAPGHDTIVRDKHLIEGGWIEKPGAIVFNQYRQPPIINGNPGEAAPWLDLLARLYPDPFERQHILDVLAFKLQNPAVKINHALVLGGNMRIGKDTLLVPFKRALGSWNCAEARPVTIMGAYNGYMRSVLLMINETRDLGEVKKYQFYDHMKDVIAAPPETVMVNEKYEKQIHVLNVCLVIMTTNYRADGLHLPPGDGRHFPVWSDTTREDFEEGFFKKHYKWLNHGGDASVATWLRERDVSDFDPGAPPPATEMFREIVEQSRAPEAYWLEDIIGAMGRPAILIMEGIAGHASEEQKEWLRRNQKAVPHRLEDCGYVRVAKPGSDNGRWKIAGKWQNVYGRKDIPAKDKISEARQWEADT